MKTNRITNAETAVDSSTTDALLTSANLAQNPMLAAGFPDDKNPVVIEQLFARYCQKSDSNEEEGLQFLEISTEDAGGGIYYVFKTERWACDNLNDLIKVLNDFEVRLSACR